MSLKKVLKYFFAYSPIFDSVQYWKYFNMQYEVKTSIENVPIQSCL